MIRVSSPRWLSTLAAGLGLLMIGGALSGAEREAPRVKLGRVELPGIDLGVEPRVSMAAIAGRSAARLHDRLAQRALPGRVIVQFRATSSESARAASRRSASSVSSARAPWGDFEILEIDPARDPEATASALAARGDVEFAQADYVARPLFRPNDPLYAQQWNLPAIQLEQAWDINEGATSAIVVAVLDGGVAFDNAAFEYQTFPVFSQGRVYPSLGRIIVPFGAAPELGGLPKFVTPRDFIWGDNDPVDTNGHGTHVAGTIGQLTNNGVGVAGVAFNVRIMPVKVLAEQWDLVFGAPNVGTVSIIASGIRYAADNGARVINMSLGFDGDITLPAIEDAINYAVGKDAVVVVAGGNSFEDGNPVEALAEIAARIDGVISVGAVGPDLNRAFYSSSRASVELTAPGGNFRLGDPAGGILQQTYDAVLSVRDPLDGPVSGYRAPRFDMFRYEPYQGTSMAAPHVSGVAAMLMQQGLTSPAAIEAALKRFATDRGPTGRDDDYGFGIVNARNTLRGLGLAR